MASNEAILARLETEVSYLKKDLEEQKAQFKEMDEKLQKLLDAANMGRGAWWIVLKIGGFLFVVGSSLMWVYEKAKGFISVKFP